MAIATCVAAGVLATSGLSYAAVQHYTGAVDHIDVFGPLDERPTDDGATNILLVGSDDRSGMSEEERLALTLGIEDFGRHTDTMMLVHIASSGAVDVVSLPRDSVVEVPSYTDPAGTTTPAHREKLNAAYSIGGPTLLTETVEKATGVRVDHYVEVNFAGFVAIVNALGGVDVCAPTAIKDELSGLDIPAGKSTVDGAMGLSYVRARYFDPTSDLGRMNRQQQFLGSMFRKATSLGVLMNPVRLSGTVDAVLASLTADEGLDPAQVRSLLQQLQGTSPSQVSFLTLPLSDENVSLDDGGVGVEWDAAASQAIFDGLRQPTSITESIRAAIAALPRVKVPPSDVTIEVLNGSGVAGAASRAAEDFSGEGFVVDRVDNGSPTTRTTIVYDPAYTEGLATLKAALPDAQTEEKPGSGPVMSVNIGPDFTGTSKVLVAGQKAGADDSNLGPTLSAANDSCG